MWSRLVSFVHLMDFLKRLLDSRNLRDDEFVIINAEADYYVQLTFNGGHIYAEAMANYLGERRHLTDTQEAALLGMGWTRPDDETDAHTNFSREWEPEVPTESITRDLAETLRLVYVCADADMVELSGGSFTQRPVAELPVELSA